jgi:predicted dehydrogenase
MTFEPVRAASVGLGRWAEVIATAVARSDQIEIVNCFSRSEEKRSTFSQKFGCDVATSYEELLADERVEAILCTTPNTEHANTISQAAAAGKHVWTEKPIAHTWTDGKRIVEAVTEAGVSFAVGHSARLLGASRKMKELIDSGEIGNVSLIEANWSNERALELTPDMWRFYREGTPGGPLIQLLVHHFDTAQYLLGPITEVMAYACSCHADAEVDDVAALVAQFENRALSYFGSSWVSPGIYWINVYGTEANLYHQLDFNYWTDPEVDKYTTLFKHVHGSSEHTPVEIPTTDMFPDELNDFARAVRTGGKPEVGAEEALQALAVVEASIRSAEQHRPVTIAEVMG